MSNPHSATTTVVGDQSQAPSRVNSIKETKSIKAVHDKAGSHAPGDRARKDRAPVFVVVLCLFQSLAGLLFGWESGVISGLVNLPDYIQRFGVPDATSATGYSIPSTRQSLITSFMGLGALFGSLAAGQMTRMGLKKATLLSAFVFMIGCAVQISAEQQWGQIIAGRLISGFGVGSLSMIAPLYQAECSPKHLRGLITSTYQLAATIGIFLSNVVNYNSRHYTGANQWRIPLCLEFIWAAFVIVGTVLAPESPRYFAQRGNLEQSRINLGRLRDLPVGDDELEAEFQQMVESIEDDKAQADASFLDCFKNTERMRLRTLIGIAVQAGQQWTGVNFFFSYGVKFFSSAGIKDSYLIQVVLSGVNVVSTFPGMWAVDHLGRRKTLFIGSAIMFTGQGRRFSNSSEVVAGALGTADPEGVTSGKVLIAFSCIFIFGFASSWGPLGWVVAAEQFPLRVAPYCVALATSSNWLNNFILALITPYMTDAGYGNLQAKITFVWAGAIILFTLIVFFFVPETKGLSIAQVSDLYASRVPAWRSSSWDPENNTQYGKWQSGVQAQDKNTGLKLEGEHVENANPAPKRNLGEDDA